jgi:hypothetical protein
MIRVACGLRAAMRLGPSWWGTLGARCALGAKCEAKTAAMKEVRIAAAGRDVVAVVGAYSPASRIYALPTALFNGQTPLDVPNTGAMKQLRGPKHGNWELARPTAHIGAPFTF